MPLPDFLVIGASRSGTTSLHHYLGQHPEIFMCPRKSPNFFVAEDPLPAWEGPVARQMAGHPCSRGLEKELRLARSRPCTCRVEQRQSVFVSCAPR